MQKEDELLKEKYLLLPKANSSWYFPQELWDELREFCKQNEMSQSFFVYMAVKKELEDRKFKEKLRYCEPM